MNPDTTHSETGEGNHSLADFTINRLHEALEIANKSADDQMFQKREAKAENARLRELLNWAADMMDEISPARGQEIRDALARLAPAPEETQDGATMDEWYGGFAKIESTEPSPDWRELGPDEVIQEGDEVQPKHHVGGEWVKAWSFELGVKSGHFKAMRYRTRRPLPKQEEMPLEKEIKRIEWHQNYSDATVHHAIADAIRYLRDEIQKLKEAP